MTFNFCYGSAASLDTRKPLVIECIRACDPDLLGIQFAATTSRLNSRVLGDTAKSLPNDFTTPLAHWGLAAPLVNTCHNFGRPTPINLILVSRHFRVLDAAIDKSALGGCYPSDHYPVTSVLTLTA